MITEEEGPPGPPGPTYYNFETETLYADGGGPLTQAQVDSIWHHLPTTGCMWIERGNLYVQRCDDAQAKLLGPVAPGVVRVSRDALARSWGISWSGEVAS